MTFLWIDFVNSDARDYRGHGPAEEGLDDPRWLERFQRQWDLGRVNLRGKQANAALKELRMLLQRLIQALVEGRALSDRNLADLNRYLASRPVVPRLERRDDSFHMRLDPTAGGTDAVLFAVAASFAEFLATGDPSRLKLCDNPDCLWVFYDTTRSRTRKWCGDNCGNLIKVRKFRARKRS